MHSIYNFATGPLCWAAFIIFIGGLLLKFISMVRRARSSEPYIFGYFSPYFGLRSVIAWLIPFVPRNGKLNPVFTVVTFAFHICLLVAPLFLMAHVMLLQEGVGMHWGTLSDATADVMTVIVLVGLAYFAYRRCTDPTAKYVTGPKEWVLLALVAAPFLTGFLAYHQIFDYQVMVVLHILSGEAMLIAIPFTWLSHMLLFPMVRMYQGSEFGGVRHVKDW
ncbi:MAG: nitrate reductase [Desulfovibrionaceae bacterium]|jgi:nitrate reductase gamma subunit|nr:nitrate reductase [Desulfovibrionaceae bacterium]